MPELPSLSVVPHAAPRALSMAEVESVAGATFGFVGLFDMYLAHALQTEDGEHFLLACAVVAAALGAQVQSAMRWVTYLPNIWALVLGPSGAGKSVRIRKGRALLAESMKDRLLPGSSTPESLADLLRDLTPGQLKERAEQGIPAFLGVGAKFMDEYSKHLRMIQSPGYMSSAAEQLIEFYDGEGPISVSTRGSGLITISRPCLTLIAATTYSRFGEVVKPDLGYSGYMPRHIFQGLSPRPLTAPHMADAVITGDWPRLRQELATLRSHASRAVVNCSWSDAVLQRWQAYRVYLEAEVTAEARADELEPYYQRFPEQVIKLSMILSYCEGIDAGTVTSMGCQITPAALVKAIELVEHSRATVRKAVESVSASPLVADLDRVIRWLRGRAGEAPQRDVMRHMHWDADRTKKVRATGEDRGDIQVTNGAWKALTDQ